ncbi:MAG: type II toxin-antitoxin system RelE/ParE family toxin [Deltaproteobacteria bacterium]|nr:type II toxin-antitoxin system RelE/ParE family toxin [Deltaproteobacteria bacterium]
MFKVVIDELVFAEDFKSIAKNDQQRIIRTIRKKLTTEPERYGKPLRGDLKGFWKLKVDNFRVVYSINKGEIEVYAIAVGFRRDEEVYKDAVKRLEPHH